MKQGSLGVVGTGIKLVGQVTLETQAFIQHAEKVFYLVSDNVMAKWIFDLNPTAESLRDFYKEKKLRKQTYQDMVDYILQAVRQGQQVCMVLYGHPGIFVLPVHQAIKQARQEGFKAWMMPGISAEDCLFADLEIDPATHGCQTFEATEFLLRKRQVDVTSNLILWQIGVTGILDFKGNNEMGLKLLTETLIDFYDPDHEVIVYEAAYYPMTNPKIDRVSLKHLTTANVTPVSTLYCPPKQHADWDPDVAKRLGINLADLRWE